MYKKLDARVHAKEDTLRCKFLVWRNTHL